MRPAGEVRQALFKALRAGPATARVLAGRACVGLEAARHTLDNMQRADLVERRGSCRVEGVRRPVPLYALRLAPPAWDWVQLALPLQRVDGPAQS